MEQVIYNTLSNYFNRIKSLGYVSYTSVDSMLALMYIYYFKETYKLTESEQGIVEKALNCLRNSDCIISYN